MARFPLTPCLRPPAERWAGRRRGRQASLSLGERETRSPVLEVVKSCDFTMRRQRCFPLPGGEGPRV